MIFLAPPLKYCTDNAAMIGLAGLTRYMSTPAAGYSEAEYNDDLNMRARPRWPLDEDSARSNPVSGFGKRGPKS